MLKLIRFVKRFKNLILLALAGIGVAIAFAKLKLRGPPDDGSIDTVWREALKRLGAAELRYHAALDELKKPQEPQAVVDEFNEHFGG